MRPGRLLLTLVAALLAAAPAARAEIWNERVDIAARYAERRAGVESFALVDERGRLRGYRVRAKAPSASLLKAMALVAYLNHGAVRRRELRDADRHLLGPMIRRSDDAAAGAVLRTVGTRRLYHLAERAGMKDFSFAWPIWGNSTTSARDQARFFSAIDRLVVRRHRSLALRLLAHIVPSQRWGIPRVRPPGWSIHSRVVGAWAPGSSRTSRRSCGTAHAGSRSRS